MNWYLNFKVCTFSLYRFEKYHGKTLDFELYSFSYIFIPFLKNVSDHNAPKTLGGSFEPFQAYLHNSILYSTMNLVFHVQIKSKNTIEKKY